MLGKKGRVRTGYIALFLCLVLVSGIRASAEERARVLFVSSYSYSVDTVQQQIEGIKSGIGKGIALDYEFMDTRSVDDDISMQQFAEAFAYRMSKVEPYDVVILGDDAALLFALEHRNTIFQGIPLVFEAVNDEELAGQLSADATITGVMEQLSIDKNIDFGLKINPGAKKVIAILDDSVTGKAEKKRFYKCAEQYPELEFQDINASQLTTWNLQLALHDVGEDSIVIYIVMTENASGKKYSDEEAAHMISQWTKVPVLRMVESGIGQGLLGGNVVSMFKSGEIAAKIATDIIGGTSVAEIETMTSSADVYCVDEKVMEKFDIDKSVLPEDTVLINHQESFLERNKEVLLPGGILVGVLIGVILWVLYDNYRHRRLLLQLEEAREIMESASLHDFLTGLPNRSKFMKDLEGCIAERRPCTLMMLDIDNFKSINDTLGHTAGDDALKQVAARLKELHSQILTPYRYAGDEFIIIVESSQERIVEKAAHQCSGIFLKPFLLDGKKEKISGSMGIAVYPRDTENLEQLIICADHAMYQVKKNGKNRFAFYREPQYDKREEEMDEKAAED